MFIGFNFGLLHESLELRVKAGWVELRVRLRVHVVISSWESDCHSNKQSLMIG